MEQKNYFSEKSFAIVKKLAKRYAMYSGIEVEDLESEGKLGLIKATKYYSTESKAAFESFAYTCIKTAIISALDKYNPWFRHGKEATKSFSEVEKGDGCFRSRTMPLTVETRYGFQQEDFLIALEQVFKRNCREERALEMIKMHYGIGCESLSKSEIAHHFGLSEERVRQIISQALKDIRRNRHAREMLLCA